MEGLIADWLEQVDVEAFDPQRARDASKHWLAFFSIERSAGRIVRGPVVTDVTRELCLRYVKWRLAQPGRRKGTTISGGTVSRELAALRAALRWAEANGRIPMAPRVPDVPAKFRAGPRELVYTHKQIAALLEAAARVPERAHVLLFLMVMISTNCRVEALLELDAEQIKDGLIDFLAPGAQQTKKRRAVVPIAPTLKPWLTAPEGKVIRYRTVRIDPRDGTETVVERPTASIRTSFEACLVEARICRPELDAAGRAVMLPPRRKLGETRPRRKMVPLGTINTLRHTINTEHHRLGVPEAQIETAAGHRGSGTNKRNYRHLRPEYLREFIAGVERYWRLIDRFTDVHRKAPTSSRTSR